MQAVNLLPSDDLGDGRRPPKTPVLVGCIGVVLVTAVLVVMFLSASSKVSNERSALVQAQAAHAAVPAPPPPPAIDSQLPQQRETRVLALSTALGGRVVWDRLLREVSQVVPSDVWITTLSATAPPVAVAGAPVAPTTGSAPSGFTVAGCTYSQESVARFLARLDVVPDLSAMTLGSSGTGVAGATCPGKMISFSLIGNVTASAAS
jgi:Tfp pilus assembly protein PilN